MGQASDTGGSGDECSRIAECCTRIRNLAPSPNQTGAVPTGQILFEGRYLPKYHWEQVAYAKLLEVRYRNGTCL